MTRYLFEQQFIRNNYTHKRPQHDYVIVEGAYSYGGKLILAYRCRSYLNDLLQLMEPSRWRSGLIQ